MRGRSQGYHLKLAIVDNSHIVVGRLLSMLEELENVEFIGHANSVSKAVKLVEEQKPDVIILDIHLAEEVPSTNGIDLLFILRSRFPRIKVIMLTNLFEPQYRTICSAFGIDYFFDKSDDFDKIPEALETIFSQNHEHYTHE